MRTYSLSMSTKSSNCTYQLNVNEYSQLNISNSGDGARARRPPEIVESLSLSQSPSRVSVADNIPSFRLIFDVFRLIPSLSASKMTALIYRKYPQNAMTLSSAAINYIH